MRVFVSAAAIVFGAVVGSCTTAPNPPSPAPVPGEVRLDPVAADSQIIDTGDLDTIRSRGTLRILVAPQTDDALRRADGVVHLERDLAEHFAQRFGVDAQRRYLRAPTATQGSAARRRPP
ncbi:MAG: hypothetical protein AAFX94_18930, partial [Myxococcota bacterium]